MAPSIKMFLEDLHGAWEARDYRSFQSTRIALVLRLEALA